MKKNKENLEETILRRVAISLWLIIFLILIGAGILFPYTNNFRKSIFDATELVTSIHIPDVGSGPLLFLLSFIGKVLVIYIIYVLIVLFNEGMFRDSIKEALTMRRVKKYKDHYIIAGGGRVGSNVAMTLKSLNKKFVVIEKNPELVKEFKEIHDDVVEGDALDEKLLDKLGIKNAKVFVSSLGNDGDNIMQIITVKKLNKNIKVISRANYPQFIETMKKFGADKVIMPEAIGGEMIAREAARFK